MIAILVDDESSFPDPKESDDNGLVAVSKSLGVDRLIQAYKKGIFPWMKMDNEPHFWCWFSPNPRMVLFPGKLKISKSLKRSVNSAKFEIKIDYGFQDTMIACANAKRPGEQTTWIENDMIKDYSELFQLGIAHSIEAFFDGRRVGGLYGIALGKMFFGESMFHSIPEASKVCLVKLVEICRSAGVELIDCQVYTSHLEKMGGEEINRTRFLQILDSLLKPADSIVPWTSLR